MLDPYRKTYRTRLARPDDIPLIPAIERAADALFVDTEYAAVIGVLGGITEADCAEAQDRWRLWVAADPADRPVAFAECTPLDDGAVYLNQVSVLPEHGRRGLGARLIAAAADFYGDRGAQRIGLTTFRDIPWNAPYYARLGFRMLNDTSNEPYLESRIERQCAFGLRRESRVAMVRSLDNNRR